MNQIMNIFRKEVRHLRLELLASWAIMLVLDLLIPKSWTGFQPGDQPPAIAVQILTLLLFASWVVLIMRLVHGERLAGLNQFWTTRPYVWTSLLTEKAIFVLLFVYTPMLLSQMYLLYCGGFAISQDAPALMHNLLLFTSNFVLPVVGIAVVTTSFAQATIVLLGIAASAAGVYTAMVFLGEHSAYLAVPRYSPVFAAPLETVIWIVFLAVALLMQYWGRDTRKAIALLGTAAAVLFFLSMTLAGSAAASAGYATVADPPAIASIVPGDPSEVKLNLPRNPRTAVYRIPEQFSNIAPGTSFVRWAERYTLTAANGYTWTSTWRLDLSTLAPKGSREAIDIPWNVHDRLAGGPVTLHMEFLVTQYEDQPSYTIPVSREYQAVPGLGYCSAGDNALACRSTYALALGSSNYTWGDYFTYVTFGREGQCDVQPTMVPDPLSDATPPVYKRIGTKLERIGFASPFPLFSPVDVNEGFLWAVGGGDYHSCPGSPGTFTRRHGVRRVRLETQTATIILKDDSIPGQ
jgi:hypothetical protein